MQETLDFRPMGLSPILSLLMSAFALLIPPHNFSIMLHQPTERSPTPYTYVYSRSFGAWF